MADQSMVVNANEAHDSDVQNNENNPKLEEDIEDESNEEFATLNAQLDQINSILESLEMKNDIINAEFVELLKSNRETRLEFQEIVKNGSTELKKPEHQ